MFQTIMMHKRHMQITNATTHFSRYRSDLSQNMPFLKLLVRSVPKNAA